MTAQGIILLVERIDIVGYIPCGDHAFDMRIVELHIDAPLGNARYDAVELLSNLVLHELHHLILHRCTLRLGSHHLHIGGVFALLVVKRHVGRLAAGKVTGE